MLLAGRATELKAKLTQKGGKYLPTASVMKLMPAGTGGLSAVPTLERYLQISSGNREMAIQQYSTAIRDVTRVFGRYHQTVATLEEHDTYMVWIAAWAQISGFGEYVLIDDRLKPGDDGYVKPTLNDDGSQRVVMPEMLVGMLLEMVSGAKSTPKGGLKELLKAHEELAGESGGEVFCEPTGSQAASRVLLTAEQVGDASGRELAGSEATSRELMVAELLEEDGGARPGSSSLSREADSNAGLFGKGAYKDEPWGLVAMRKRIYACRKFYERWLSAPSQGALRDLNPGWAPMVTGTLDSIALLIGLKATHVPRALGKQQLAAMIGAADVDNPALVGTAAYLAKNVVDANRARTEWLLEWEEVQEKRREDKVVGIESHVGQTKSDRLQKGKIVPLPCTSDCPGKLVLDDEGRIDAASLCPPHLLMYLKELWARKLEVNVDDVKGPLWSDMARFKDKILVGQYLIAVNELSPAYKMHVNGELPGVLVMTREEEKRSGLTCRMFFEVDGQPYAVRAWGDAQHVTARFRVLAIAAQRQARKAGAETPFGNAFKCSDLKGVLSSKTTRRTNATQSVRQKVSPIKTSSGSQIA